MLSKTNNFLQRNVYDSPGFVMKLMKVIFDWNQKT